MENAPQSQVLEKETANYPELDKLDQQDVESGTKSNLRFMVDVGEFENARQRVKGNAAAEAELERLIAVNYPELDKLEHEDAESGTKSNLRFMIEMGEFENARQRVKGNAAAEAELERLIASKQEAGK